MLFCALLETVSSARAGHFYLAVTKLTLMRVVSFDVGTRNFGICIVSDNPYRIVHWEVIDTLTETGRPAKSTIDDKKRALLECLAERRAVLLDGLGRGDAVVIEQQPFGAGRGSPTMNILAHTIGAFFLLNSADAKPEFDVRLVAARSKFGVCAQDWGGEPVYREPVSDDALVGKKRNRKDEYDRYKHNKGLGVQICSAILQNARFMAWKEKFSGHRKKDDLADAFLQALSQLPPPANEAHAADTNVADHDGQGQDAVRRCV